MRPSLDSVRLLPRPCRALFGVLVAGLSVAVSPAAHAQDEAGVAAPSREPSKRLTLTDTVGRVSFRTDRPLVRVSPDGKSVLVREQGKVVAYDPETWKPLEAAPVAPPARGAAGRFRVRIDDGEVTLIDRDAAEGAARRRLTDTPGIDEREVHAAPGAVDGEAPVRVSFVRENDLVVLDVATGEEWAVTDDRQPHLLDGILDWVYQEEVYGRGDFQGHWWSPDGRRIAFLRIDETPVRPFAIVDHVPDPDLATDRGVRVEQMFYPKAGDPNPLCSLWIADIEERTVREVDLSAYPADRLIVRVGWTPAADHVVFEVQDRIQTSLDLMLADPSTGASKRLVRLEMPRGEDGEPTGWVEVPGLPTWLSDGSFLLRNEVATGYARIERRDADGSLRHVVAEGRRPDGSFWPVGSVVELDEEQGLLWFTGAGDAGRAIERHLFRAALDGSGIVQLTSDPGTHSVDLGEGGKFFVDVFTAHDDPGEVRVCAADGGVLRRFATPEPAAVAEYGLSRKQLLSIPTRDGIELDATLIRPEPFDESVAHPVWIDTYSGPDAPSVRDAWSYSAWHQFLAQQGCLVLQVNVRTASGRGHAWTIGCYRRFGVQELRDLEDAVAWLTKEPFADAERVGIEGWSYGGFMAAYALTHSRAFRVGVAGAGVYDWQLYDTIYTERYMSTPQRNPEGYAASSVIAAAEHLHGRLVLLHGTIDDNVHVQNAMRLARALQEHDRSFELMLYPNSRHGIRSPRQRLHLQRLKWKAVSQEFGLRPAPVEND
jgi:dipeptidyl-peptidase-4